MVSTRAKEIMNQLKSDIQSGLQQGMRYFQSGRLQQAETTFRNVLEKAPADINALQFLGLVVFQLGRAEEGEKLLRKAIRKNGKIAKLHFNLGHMLDAQGKLKEALFAYNAALKLNPKDEWTQVSLGSVYGKMGRLDEGIEACNKALKINPSNSSALTNLGQCLWHSGKTSEAIDALEKALEIEPNHPEALSNLGALLLSEKELVRAEEVLRSAIDVGARNPDVLGNLAGVLLSKREYDEALELCKDVVEISPASSESYSKLGMVLQASGKWQEAIDSYNKAISISPDLLDVYGRLGSLYEKTHDFENAEKAVNSALGIDQNYSPALQTKAVLLRRKGMIKEAIELLKQLSADEDNASADVNFELGRLFDLEHNSEQALHHFTLANDVVYNSKDNSDAIKAESLAMIDHLEGMIDSDEMSSIFTSTNPADVNTPIFLVGFPRSGTTLLDQILDSHSKLQVMEEQPALRAVRLIIDDLPEGYPHAMANLSTEKIDELRMKYFETVDSCIERDSDTLLVDKLPLNLLQMPLIKLLFPNAKIILAIRHPCDVILSNFMQHFDVNMAMANFFTLEDAVHYYGRTMSLWEKYTSKLTMDYHVVKYESLVDNFNQEVRGLLEFLGVDWEDRVENYNEHAKNRVINTPSYESVVEPINTSAKYRWKRYEEQLNPYCKELKPFVERFGYT
jgi:tetratricopeptide (TPR) repeat protein